MQGGAYGIMYIPGGLQPGTELRWRRHPSVTCPGSICLQPNHFL